MAIIQANKKNFFWEVRVPFLGGLGVSKKGEVDFFREGLRILLNFNHNH